MTEPYSLYQPDAAGPVVLVCEHASNAAPAEFGPLGLDPAQMAAHIAWDPGALPVARAMADRIGAALVAGTISRLIYDLNRPPDAPGAMPGISDGVVIALNQGLSPAARAARAAAIHAPFHAQLAETLAARQGAILVTVHSFTPVYQGRTRTTALGVLHDSDPRLADALLAEAPAQFGPVRRNDPYGPEDGVTHTLQRHGDDRLNVMLEIRSDLIATAQQQTEMAGALSDWLAAALHRLEVPV